MKSHTSSLRSLTLILRIFRKAPALAALAACLPQLPVAFAIVDPSDPFGVGPEQTVTVPLSAPSAPPLRSFVPQPLSFERNDGQTDSSVGFLSRGRGYTIFLAGDEVVMALHNPLPQGGKPAGSSAAHERQAGEFANKDEDQTPAASVPRGVLRMRLAGANRRPAVEGEDHLRATANYFIGNEAALWRTNIPTFGKVRYREVYSGIDLVFYGNEGQLEYDFVVAPSADPNQIVMEFEGADELEVDPRGDLVLKVGEREVRWQKPRVFQEANGSRKEVVGTYRLRARDPQTTDQNEKLESLKFVSFALASYDPALPLVVDPRLVYSTYLGGSGNDYGLDLAVDGQGNVYVAGITTSLDFPTKAAVTPSAPGGGRDIFVAKFNTAGELLFSTYLEGSGIEPDRNAAGRGIVMALTSTGDCYVAGGTSSTNFPTVNPLQASLRGKSDAFVTALKSDGSVLLFSTYLGGSGWDFANGIAIGPGNDVFLVGGTQSSNFPTTNAFQPTATGNGDAFITRLEAGGKSIRYSTFYGWMTSFDQAQDLAVDADGCVYVALTAHLSDPIVGNQWVITKISADGSTPLFEIWWPAFQSAFTISPRIALAPNGRVVFAGAVETYGGEYLPAMNEPNPSIDGWSEAYIALFDATNGSYVSAAYFGGSGHDFVARVLVDAAGDIIVAGSTGGQIFEPSGFPVTDPLESGPIPGTSEDVFVAKFRSTDLSLISSTLLGGPGNEDCYGMALDPAGNVWLAGATTGQFPTVNAFQPQFAGEYDTFLAKLSFGEELRISLAGPTVRVSWPLAASNFVLETTDALPSAAWTTVSATPIPDGDKNVVTLEIGTSPKLFRLKKQ